MECHLVKLVVNVARAGMPGHSTDERCRTRSASAPYKCEEVFGEGTAQVFRQCYVSFSWFHAAQQFQCAAPRKGTDGMNSVETRKTAFCYVVVRSKFVTTPKMIGGSVYDAIFQAERQMHQLAARFQRANCLPDALVLRDLLVRPYVSEDVQLPAAHVDDAKVSVVFVLKGGVSDSGIDVKFEKSDDCWEWAGLEEGDALVLGEDVWHEVIKRKIKIKNFQPRWTLVAFYKYS